MTGCRWQFRCASRAFRAGFVALLCNLSSAICFSQIIGLVPTPIGMYTWDPVTQNFDTVDISSTSGALQNTPQAFAFYGFNTSLGQWVPCTSIAQCFGGASYEVNGSGIISSNPVNFINGPGVLVSNPSAGNIQFSVNPAGVTTDILPGTGIGCSPEVSGNCVGAVTVTNTGVTEIIPGTNITCTPDSAGNCVGNVTVNATAGGANFQTQVIPPITGQFVFVPAGSVSLISGDPGTGSSSGTLQSGTVVDAGCCGGLGDNLWGVNWTGYTLPSYVLPANITAVYGVAISALSNGPFVSSEITCTQPGGGTISLLPAVGFNSYAMQQVTEAFSVIATSLPTVVCTAQSNHSTPGQQTLLNIPQIGLLVYYTGAAPPVNPATVLEPPLYLNTSVGGAGGTMGVDPNWIFPGLDLMPGTLPLLSSDSYPYGTVFLINNGASATDCSTGGGTTLVLCTANNSGGAYTALSLGSTGTVTSVDGSLSEGAETAVAGTVGPITAAGTIRGAFPYALLTGNQTLADTERGHFLLSADSGNDVYTLPAPAGTSFQNGWYAEIKNGSTTGTITLTPAGATTIDGLATFVVPAHTAVAFNSDGTNYHTTMLSPVGNNAQGLFFASPAGASGPPGMRAIATSDLSSVVVPLANGGTGGTTAPVAVTNLNLSGPGAIQPVNGCNFRYQIVDASGTVTGSNVPDTCPDTAGSPNNGTVGASAPTIGTFGALFLSLPPGTSGDQSITTPMTTVQTLIGHFCPWYRGQQNVLSTLNTGTGTGGAIAATYPAVFSTTSGTTGLRFLLGSQNGFTTNALSPSVVPYTLGNWTYIASAVGGCHVVAWDLASGGDQMYIDGQPLAQAVTSTNFANATITGGTYKIGTGQTPLGNSNLRGWINYLEGYPTALTAAQVLSESQRINSIMAARPSPFGPAYNFGSRTPLVAFVGDSLTATLDGSSQWPTTAYTAPSGYSILNFGLASQTLRSMAYQFGQQVCPSLLPAAPNIIGVWGGTNDAQFTIPAADIVSSAGQLQQQIQSCLPGTASYETTMISRTGIDAAKDLLNPIFINTWKQQGWTAIDDLAEIAVLGADGANTNTACFNGDKIHLTGPGAGTCANSHSGYQLVGQSATDTTNYITGSTLASPTAASSYPFTMTYATVVVNATGCTTGTCAITLPGCDHMDNMPFTVMNYGNAGIVTVAPPASSYYNASAYNLNGSTAAVVLTPNTTTQFDELRGTMAAGGCSWVQRPASTNLLTKQHEDYWSIGTALFATSTVLGPVYYEVNGGTLVGITARLSGTISCTVAPTINILDLGTSVTTAYASGTSLNTLATGTSDGAFTSIGLTNAIAAGHYVGLGFSAGTCVTAPQIDATITVQ